MLTNIPPWLLAVAVAGVTLPIMLVFRALTNRREAALDRRLAGRTGVESVEDDEPGVLARHAKAAAAKGEGGRHQIDQSFEQMVARSGLQMTSGQALAFIALTGVALFTALYLWREELWLSILGLVVGLSIPLAVLWYLQSRYLNRLQQQLPDAIFLLARSLRAGLSFEQALDLVGEQGTMPLAAEFRRANGQIRLGLTIPSALLAMAQRVPLLDMNLLVSISTYYQSTGGNLPLLLDRLAAGARDRNQFRGQFFAATAQGRVTAVFLGLAPLVMLVGYALFEPEHVQTFFKSANGWLLLGGAFLLQIIGVIWLSRLLKVEY